jgi:23S rRNA (uracil1939-C5)-methyltransferase
VNIDPNTIPPEIEPPCPVFGACGGCSLQHLSIETQRKLKLDSIEQAVTAAVGYTPSNGVGLLGSDLPAYGYRRKVELHLHRDAAFGFYAPATRKLLEVEKCFLATDEINHCIGVVREYRQELAATFGEIIFEEYSDQAKVIFKLRHKRTRADILPAQLDTLQILATKLPDVWLNIHDDILPLANFVSATPLTEIEDTVQVGHFAQVNKFGNRVLIDELCRLIPTGPITEFYAGAGNFTFPLARQGVQITAVEADRRLVEVGSRLAQLQRLDSKIQFVRKSAEKYVRKYPIDEIVLIDPPRSGAEEAVKKFVEVGVKRLIYVSCSLPTLARDLKILQEGGFRLIRTDFIDMFSQTKHVETVSELTRD